MESSMRPLLIAPSILSADFGDLAADVTAMMAAGRTGCISM